MFSGRLLLSPLVVEYLAEVLSEDQQVWLTDQIMRKPLGFAEFLMSAHGHQTIRLVVDMYKEHIELVPKKNERAEKF